MGDVELERERNDLWFGSTPPVNHGDVGATPGGHREPDPPEDPETARYGIRIVYPDGLENDVEFETSLRVAHMVARSARDLLAGSVFKPRVVIIHLDTGKIIDEEEYSDGK